MFILGSMLELNIGNVMLYNLYMREYFIFLIIFKDYFKKFLSRNNFNFILIY